MPDNERGWRRRRRRRCSNWDHSPPRCHLNEREKAAEPVGGDPTRRFLSFATRSFGVRQRELNWWRRARVMRVHEAYCFDGDESPSLARSLGRLASRSAALKACEFCNSVPRGCTLCGRTQFKCSPAGGRRAAKTLAATATKRNAPAGAQVAQLGEPAEGRSWLEGRRSASSLELSSGAALSHSNCSRPPKGVSERLLSHGRAAGARRLTGCQSKPAHGATAASVHV